jgi:hypothetical protein
MLELSILSVAATTASIQVTNLPADGTLEFQVAVNPKFLFCVCPIVSGAPLTSPINLVGLNQDTSYYVRMRAVRLDGSIEPWSLTLGLRTPLSVARSTAPAAVMIEPAMIVVPAPVLAWTATHEVDGYPVANLGIDAPVAWRSHVIGSHSFTAQIAPAQINTIALLMSNAPENALVTIRGGNDNLTTAFVHGPVAFRASANMPGRPGFHSLICLPSAQSYPFWKVDIAATLNGDLLHLEHAVFGMNRVTKNHSVDKTEQPIDYGTLERSRSGNPIRVSGARGRKVDFDISMLTEAQFEISYGDLGQLVGSTDPVLVVPNAKANAFLHDRILYGALTSNRIVNPASPYYTRTFSVESILP